MLDHLSSDSVHSESPSPSPSSSPESDSPSPSTSTTTTTTSESTINPLYSQLHPGTVIHVREEDMAAKAKPAGILSHHHHHAHHTRSPSSQTITPESHALDLTRVDTADSHSTATTTTDAPNSFYSAQSDLDDTDHDTETESESNTAITVDGTSPPKLVDRSPVAYAPGHVHTNSRLVPVQQTSPRLSIPLPYVSSSSSAPPTATTTTTTTKLVPTASVVKPSTSHPALAPTPTSAPAHHVPQTRRASTTSSSLYPPQSVSARRGSSASTLLRSSLAAPPPPHPPTTTTSLLALPPQRSLSTSQLLPPSSPGSSSSPQHSFSYPPPTPPGQSPVMSSVLQRHHSQLGGGGAAPSIHDDVEQSIKWQAEMIRRDRAERRGLAAAELAQANANANANAAHAAAVAVNPKDKKQQQQQQGGGGGGSGAASGGASMMVGGLQQYASSSLGQGVGGGGGGGSQPSRHLSMTTSRDGIRSRSRSGSSGLGLSVNGGGGGGVGYWGDYEGGGGGGSALSTTSLALPLPSQAPPPPVSLMTNSATPSTLATTTTTVPLQQHARSPSGGSLSFGGTTRGGERRTVSGESATSAAAAAAATAAVPHALAPPIPVPGPAVSPPGPPLPPLIARTNSVLLHRSQSQGGQTVISYSQLREQEKNGDEKEGTGGAGIPLVGNLIGTDHENYVLMYNMLTGIRIGVSRCQAKAARPLTDADYSARHKFSFDIVGNELTPSVRYDFKFKDYAPWVFRELREYFFLDPSDYLISLTAKYILSELGSPGKSGSFFYFSRDYRFIIKTIRHSEHKFLRSILREYHEHVKRNPHTLLSRFYGLHRVKLPHGRKIHFVIMNNLFPPHRDIHETYDLKGSSVGRLYPEDKAKQNPHAVLKDLNWLERGRQLDLGPEKKALFEEQLRRDTELMQKLGIMDYSLLTGVHMADKGNEDRLREGKLSVFQPDPPPPDARPPPRPDQLSRRPTTTKSKTHRDASALRAAVQRSDPQSITSGQDLPEHDTTSTERTRFLFYQDEGGMRATGEANEDLGVIYYLGIIDILTPYTFVKRLEHFFKGIKNDKHCISAVPPKEYGDRFLNFIRSCIRGNPQSLRPKMWMPPPPPPPPPSPPPATTTTTTEKTTMMMRELEPEQRNPTQPTTTTTTTAIVHNDGQDERLNGST